MIVSMEAQETIHSMEAMEMIHTTLNLEMEKIQSMMTESMSMETQ